MCNINFLIKYKFFACIWNRWIHIWFYWWTYCEEFDTSLKSFSFNLLFIFNVALEWTHVFINGEYFAAEKMFLNNLFKQNMPLFLHSIWVCKDIQNIGLSYEKTMWHYWWYYFTMNQIVILTTYFLLKEPFFKYPKHQTFKNKHIIYAAVPK